MISLAVFNDQELPVSPEVSGENNFSVIGRDHLGAGAGFDIDSLPPGAPPNALAIASGDGTDGRIGQKATRPADRLSLERRL